MRRGGLDLLHHAHDFLELGHQLGLVLQPAGGIDDQHVGGVAPRRGQGLECEARGIRPLRARDHGRAGALTPDLQLLDRGGAERVAGREHDLAALGAEARRELADGGGLARAVHADDQNDERLGGRVDHQRLRDRAEHLLDLRGEDRLHFGVADLLVVASFADRGRDARGGIDAEVGADQQFLQFLDGRGVKLALRYEVGDRAADRGRGTLQAAGEALPPALLCSGLGVSFMLRAVIAV